MRLTGSSHTSATHGRSGSTTSSTSGRSSWAGAVTVPSSRSAGGPPSLLAELALEDLARGVARQLVDHLDLAGHREAGELLAHELLQLLLVDGGAVDRHDVRDEPGAPLLVGHVDHGDVV